MRVCSWLAALGTLDILVRDFAATISENIPPSCRPQPAQVRQAAKIIWLAAVKSATMLSYQTDLGVR